MDWIGLDRIGLDWIPNDTLGWGRGLGGWIGRIKKN